jgi:hypothetical protein
MPDDLNNNANVNADPANTASGATADSEAVDTAAAEAAAKEAADKAAAEAAAKEAADTTAADAAANEAADKATAEAAAKEAADKATAEAAAKEAADKATAEAATKEAADKAADEKGHAEETDGANGNGNGQAGRSRPCTEREKIFTWLTVGQYFVLGAIGVIIVTFLFNGLLGNNTGPFLFALAKPEVARGIITFLVAAGTVSLAVLLVMAAIMSSGSKDLENRFAFGKEVLTLLIGILGTIVGFYYGSAQDNKATFMLSPVALSEPAPEIGGQFTLDAVVIGGAPPYTYSIKFNPPNIIPDVIDQQSAGAIHHEFTIPTDTGAKADQVITFTVDVKDSKEQTFSYNKDGKQSITLKAAAAATPTP